MGENSTCKSSLYCITAFLVVLFSILVQVLIVGIFFLLPFYQDCDNTIFAYTSPIEISSNYCLANSSINGSFIPPPTCNDSNSLHIPYCYDSGCKDTECLTGSRCCCRSIPQVLPIDCGAVDLYYNTSCVCAICERSLHSVILQVYNSSDLNNSTRTGLAGVSIQFGNYLPENTTMNGLIRLNDIPEGEYPISTISTEYFHASTLSVNFYSPSEIVYIINVKNLYSDSPMMSGCDISPMIQSIHTTQFDNSINDLLTLPNTFIHNGSFFIPSMVAYTYSSNGSVDFNITNCNSKYTLFYYKDGVWNKSSSGLNLTYPILWSLSNDTRLAVHNLELNLGRSSLLLDRGAVLLLTNNSWFVSRVTTDTRTILSIPVISSPSIKIYSTTSMYSHLIPTSPMLELGKISTTDLVFNSSDKADKLENIDDDNTAVLSVTNSPTFNLCYFPINVSDSTSSKIFSLITRRNTDDITVYLSTLKTNDNYVCLPYPCDVMTYYCEVSVTIQGESNPISGNCTDLEQRSIGSNALALMECNSKLQTMKFEN
ncbi:hypothetical protein LOD99_16158 [Oopsacas minuta]|uniref:Uncharacterized protein n=1 Tax=Oopsacas minuta TaxID=111878 RepID=A0AAV7K7D9_9METZ|nr:hypothetical protein LOD99_16158 [Oopsacas minuta]